MCIVCRQNRLFASGYGPSADITVIDLERDLICSRRVENSIWCLLSSGLLQKTERIRSRLITFNVNVNKKWHRFCELSIRRCIQHTNEIEQSVITNRDKQRSNSKLAILQQRRKYNSSECLFFVLFYICIHKQRTLWLCNFNVSSFIIHCLLFQLLSKSHYLFV